MNLRVMFAIAGWGCLALCCALPVAAQTRMSAEEQRQLESDVTRRLQEQNLRRGFASPRTTEPALARYYADFATQIECYADTHYPRVAMGASFEAIATVSVAADGRVEKVEIDRGSGSPLVDAAVRELARGAGPFPAFTGELKSRYRALDLSSRWHFGPVEGGRRNAC